MYATKNNEIPNHSVQNRVCNVKQPAKKLSDNMESQEKLSSNIQENTSLAYNDKMSIEVEEELCPTIGDDKLHETKLESDAVAIKLLVDSSENKPETRIMNVFNETVVETSSLPSLSVSRGNGKLATSTVTTGTCQEACMTPSVNKNDTGLAVTKKFTVVCPELATKVPHNGSAIPTNRANLTVAKPLGLSNNTVSTGNTSQITNCASSLRPVAKLLHNIGYDLVCEQVCREVQLETKSLTENQHLVEGKQQLAQLAVIGSQLTEKNQAFSLPVKRCRCQFHTESQNVMTWHCQLGNFLDQRGTVCCLCSFIARNSGSFVRHMKKHHNVKALVSPKMAQYQCQICYFESNQQQRVELHVNRCQEIFVLDMNLRPVRTDNDIPVFFSSMSVDVPESELSKNTLSSAKNAVSFPSKLNPVKLPAPHSLAVTSSVTLSLPLTSITRFQTTLSSLTRASLPAKTVTTYSQPCRMITPSLPGPLTSASLVPGLRHTNSQTHPKVPLPQTTSQTPLIVPPLAGRDISQPRFRVPPPINQVIPGTCLMTRTSGGPDILQLFASQSGAPFMRLQNSAARSQFMQVGSQMCTLLQHSGQPVLTPFTGILPRPAIPVMPLLHQNHNSPRNDWLAAIADQAAMSVLSKSPAATSSIIVPNLLQGSKSSVAKLPQAQTTSTSSSYGMLICELCDGFVKDHDSLLVHFRYGHRVSMEESKLPDPPYLCPSCSQTFFTVSGMLRHFRLTHASDSSLTIPLDQCPICHMTNLRSVVGHLSERHRGEMTLSMEFKYCGICSMWIGDVRKFEQHMLEVHRNLFPNRNILWATIATSLPGPIQPSKRAKVAQYENKSKAAVAQSHKCEHCTLTFSSAADLDSHVSTMHVVKCSRCKSAYQTVAELRRHFHDMHAATRDPCPVCLEPILIGRPLVRHMKSRHLKKCSVRIERLRQTDFYDHDRNCKIAISAKSLSSSVKRNHPQCVAEEKNGNISSPRKKKKLAL